MPYMIVERDSQFCVYKHDADNKPVGESLGCHPTRKEAEDQMSALYIHADKSSALKAVGDWELEVLAVPFGGPNNGKDSVGEYFSERTNIHLENFSNPLVTYYHGYDSKGKPQGDPVSPGKVKPDSWEKRKDGWWVRVVLDKASEYAKQIWEGAKQGLARASSGSINHLVRKAKDGEILNWGIAELAVFDTLEGKEPSNNFAVALPVMKSRYDLAGITMPDLPDNDGSPDDAKGAKQRAKSGNADDPDTNTQGVINMDEKELQQLVASTAAEAVKSAMETRDKAESDAKAAAEAQQKVIDEALKKQKDELEAEFAKKNRPAMGDGFPHITEFGEITKFDNLGPDDIGYMIGVLGSAKRSGLSQHGATEAALKALAIRTIDSKDDDKYGALKASLKHIGIPLDAAKANDINYSTYSGYGDQWVPTMYSTRLWDKIRLGTPVVGNVPTVVVPQGFESITIPVMGASATFYKVAQATAMAANPGDLTKTFTVSKPTTPTNQTLSVSKLGAATTYTGELEEDSMIPWASTMRADTEEEGKEIMESLVIDGDTETTQYLNINDVGATPSSTDYFLIMDGFRKLALVTNTANARSAGALTVEDFLETLKLLGLGGKNAVQRDKVAFIIDLWTSYKVLELSEIKTKDSFSAPTLENGELTSIWGHKVIASANMHRTNTDTTYGLKAQSNGYIDRTTAADNVCGAILGVRWDQWQLGIKRNWLFETQRFPRADATEITASTRVGMVYRDTEASAISYGVIV